MTRPIKALIHLQHLRHNLLQMRHCAPNSQIMAVIKADAYGHGLHAALRSFDSADALALLNIEDAISLRQIGYVKPIILLEGVFDAEELRLCQAHQLTPVFHHASQLAWLNGLSVRQGHFPALIKINTGMNRLGFNPAALAHAWATLSAQPCVSDIALMSHFACADAEDAQTVTAQMRVFDAACAPYPAAQSLANSAAIIQHPSSHRDWVRAGIALYGSSPFAHQTADSLGLLAGMSLQSQIIATQNLQAGDCVGYGASFCADHPMRIGIVACGYADGYPRHAPTGTPVWVQGQISCLIGRVSMDMLCVDLSDIPQADVGSPVELWGQQNPIDRVAQAAGTIAYELMCAVAPRVQRVLCDSTIQELATHRSNPKQNKIF